MKSNPIITVISDCRGSNDSNRQILRYRSLFGVSPIFIPAEHELEAAGNLVDAIDASKPQPLSKIFVVNVAPRGNKEHYPNGIPFCFSRTSNGIIIGTPNCFSLAKKLGLLSKVYETDVYKVCCRFGTKYHAKKIANSQFRSLEYLPLLADWLHQGSEVPSQEFEAKDLKGDFIWLVDEFGNCKTTVFSSERESCPGLSKYSFVENLADVPRNGKPYVTIGSSGWGNRRFCEIVIQRQNASDALGLKIGDSL